MKKTLLKFKAQLTQFKIPIKNCLICRKTILKPDIFSILNYEYYLCRNCRNKMKPIFETKTIHGFKCTFIYSYDQIVKELINKIKVFHDIELCKVFLERYINYFKIKYKNYYLVPAPSHRKDDEERGFNHVKEIFRLMKLPTIDLFWKNKQEKQTDKDAKNRYKVKEIIQIENIDLYGKKILLVDDVYTTGSTIKTMINLAEKLRPKKIEILIIAKTNYEQK